MRHKPRITTITLSCALLVTGGWAAVGPSGSGPLAAEVTAQVIQPVPPPQEVDPVPQTTPEAQLLYEHFTYRGARSLATLKPRLGEQAQELVLKINRLDAAHLRIGDRLVIPARTADLLLMSPFPTELSLAEPVEKLILVSRRAQAFGAYEAGKLVWWGPTSTGKKSTETPEGLYYTNWKSRETRSSVNRSWVLPWYFNIDNRQGVGLHEYDLPGYPASHGCVRLLEADAKWIFKWADQWVISDRSTSVIAYGTPVLIFGDYPYGQKPAWKRLPENPQAAAVSVAEIEAALSNHMPLIEARAQARRSALTATVDSSLR